MSEERVMLMAPGPAELPWRVIQAMMRPAIAHNDPDYAVAVLDRTLIRLREILQTENEIIALPGSGRVALESAVTSVVEPGDRVLAVVAGTFGEWLREMALRVGGQVDVLAVPWGQPLDLEVLERRLQQGHYKILTMVHNETSTGSTYPVGAVAPLAERYGLCFLVDTVSSLGGIEVCTDAWHIDFNMTAPEKCLTTPMGLALVSVSPRAWKIMAGRKKPATSYAFDLLRWQQEWLPAERGGTLIHGWRRQPVIAPVHLVYALEEAVNMALEEGLTRRYQRHALAARAFRAGLAALGLALFPHPSLASNSVTCLRLPEGVKASQLIGYLKSVYHIGIRSGMEAFADTTLRVGHMGVGAAPEHIVATLAGLEGALRAAGQKVPLGAGVQAAMAIYEGQNRA